LGRLQIRRTYRLEALPTFSDDRFFSPCCGHGPFVARIGVGNISISFGRVRVSARRGGFHSEQERPRGDQVIRPGAWVAIVRISVRRGVAVGAGLGKPTEAAGPDAPRLSLGLGRDPVRGPLAARDGPFPSGPTGTPFFSSRIPSGLFLAAPLWLFRCDDPQRFVAETFLRWAENLKTVSLLLHSFVVRELGIADLPFLAAG